MKKTRFLVAEYTLILCCFLLFVSGCAPQPAEKSSEPEQIMDQQRNAKKPMASRGETDMMNANRKPEDSLDSRGSKRHQEQMNNLKKKMKAMEQKPRAVNAWEAAQIALETAKKWDKDAKLYCLEGEKGLLANGSAKMWTAYFATKVDSETDGKNTNHKYVIIVFEGRVMKSELHDTPEKIVHVKDCPGLLPDDIIDSEEAILRCQVAIGGKYKSTMDEAVLSTITCRMAPVEGSPGTFQPEWKLNMKIKEEYVRVAVHGVTGNPLSVK
jgi:hypothetical protein